MINVPGALSSEILGEWAEDGFSSIDVLPDFDGDGRSDVAFGSRGSDQNGASAGTVFVLYGAANLPPSIDLNASTPVLGKRIEGVAGSRTGFEVRALADINGDGLGDLGITAADAGRNAYVIYSSERILGSAFEAQPPARIGPTRFDLGRSPGTPWTNEPALRPTRTVGDLNNDGRGDLVADGYCLNGDCTERVSMVALGSAALSVNTQQLTGRTGFVVLNAQRTSAAGNFNGDGFGDLLVQGNNRAMVLYGKVLQGRSVFPATVSLGVPGGPPRSPGTTELRFAASTAILREARGIGDFGGGPESDLLVTWCPFGCTFGSERRARVVFGTPDRPSTLAVDNLSAGRFVDLTTANGVSLSMASNMPLGDFGGDSKSDLALFINNDGVADPRTALIFGGASLPASIDPLTTAQGFRTTGPSPTITAVGRFTNGAKDDIAFDYFSGSVQIYRGRSGTPGDNLFPLVNSAVFGPQFSYCADSIDLPPPSGLLSSADLNGDGQLELLLRSRGEGRARSAGAAPWVRGRGVAWENRAYSVCNQTDPPALIVTGESQAAQLVPIGDWDGDGKLDFVDLVRGLIYRGAAIPALP
ncbi:MAG: hypothetical protein IPO66_11130 [Rhodanobacteraceae bacterium]|nr:hypothetical protein [Rhodanobacteraceae bacterium]